MRKTKDFLKDLFAQKNVPNLSMGKYEVPLAFFSLVSLLFLRNEPNILYPHILLVLAGFLGFNLLFNFVTKEKSEIDLRFYFLINFINCFIIFFIIMFSGGKFSSFWFLLLLPVMTMALSGDFLYSYLIVILSFSFLAYFYVIDFSGDFQDYFFLIFKGFVISASSFFIRDNASARKTLEAEISFKRKQTEVLLEEVLKAKKIKDEEKELLNIDNEKRDFDAVAVHDLKNLISIISMISEILQKDEGAHKKEFEKLASASKMAARLAKYALSSKKDYVFSPQRFDLRTLFSEAIELLEYKLIVKKIHVKNELPEGRFFVNVDKISFQRSIVNLLLNSYIELNDGGVINISASEIEGKAKILISDNGPGFPQQILDGIKPFNTGRIKQGGTGLGLYSVLKEIAKNEGEFRIYNLAQSGACCEIILPLAKA